VKTPKPLFRPTPCRRHSAYLAATCPECYDLALAQQALQRSMEQKTEHEKYLDRVAASPA
jgi:hypothetical protein